MLRKIIQLQENKFEATLIFFFNSIQINDEVTCSLRRLYAMSFAESASGRLMRYLAAAKTLVLFNWDSSKMQVAQVLGV